MGGVAEWLMAADCKSAALTRYVGSNPTPTIRGARLGARRGVCGSARAVQARSAGVAQLVERQPSKLNVAGSSPVARLTPGPARTGDLGCEKSDSRGTTVPRCARDAARVAQSVERILGKDEVTGSIPVASSQGG